MSVVRIDLEVQDKGTGQIIQNIGGQLKGLGPLGASAGAAIGAGFSIASKALEVGLEILKAIPAEIGRVISMASGLADLSAKTQMTTDSLQRLKYAGSLVGVTLDEIAAASLKAQRNLVENPKAFEKWGLSAKALRDLKPEEQLAAIADVIRKIPEPAKQVAAAMDLMGKGGAANMALLRSDLHEVLQEADNLGVAMGEKLVNGLDDVDDATTRARASWEALKNLLFGTLVVSTGAADFFNDLASAVGALNRAAKDNGALGQWVDLVKKLVTIPETVTGVALVRSLLGKGLGLIGSTTPASKGKGLDTSADQIDFDRIMKDAIKLTEDEVKAHDKAEAAAKRHAEGLKKIAQEGKYTLDIQKEFNRLLDDMANDIAKAWMNAPTTNRDLASQVLANGPGGKKASAFFDPGDKTLSESTKKLIADAEKGAEKWQRWGDVIATVAQQVGGSLGAALSGLGGIFDGLAARQKQAAANLEAYGSTAMTTGQKVQAAAQAAAGAIAIYQQAYQSKSVAKGALMGASQGAAQGSAFGAPGMIVGGIVGLGLGIFGAKKGQAAEIKALSADFDDLMAQARKAGVVFEHTFDPRNAKQYKAAIDEVKKALDTNAEAQEKLHDALSRYNFTLAEQGPILAAQELDQKFGQIYQDWMLLTKAGVDHNAVMRELGPSVGTFVDAAVAAGTEIPIAMKPIIDDLYQHGKLLHENGEAYSQAEVDGLSYAQTMSQMFMDLIKHVEELVNAIRGIPDKTVNVTVNRNVVTNGGGSLNYDGSEDHDGDPSNSYAAGLFLSSASQGGIARYHRGERVEITPAANSAARNERGGGGDSGPSTIVVPVSIGGQKLDEIIIRRMRGKWITVPA